MKNINKPTGKRLTTEQFIERAVKKHGNRFDYSKVKYEGTHIPVVIICSKHGEYSQKPHDHLLTKGCPRCSFEIMIIRATKPKHERYKKDFSTRLNRRYGLPFEEYRKLFIKQEGKCGICGNKFIMKKDIKTDHNHITNKVRGLLCNNCNCGLGMLGDDIGIIGRALDYWKEYAE